MFEHILFDGSYIKTSKHACLYYTHRSKECPVNDFVNLTYHQEVARTLCCQVKTQTLASRRWWQLKAICWTFDRRRRRASADDKLFLSPQQLPELSVLFVYMFFYVQNQ